MKKSACQEFLSVLEKISENRSWPAYQQANNLPNPPAGYDTKTLKELPGAAAAKARQTYTPQPNATPAPVNNSSMLGSIAQNRSSLAAAMKR